jgi:hypothetical protein
MCSPVFNERVCVLTDAIKETMAGTSKVMHTIKSAVFGGDNHATNISTRVINVAVDITQW